MIGDGVHELDHFTPALAMFSYSTQVARKAMVCLEVVQIINAYSPRTYLITGRNPYPGCLRIGFLLS
jgi:hypothetical protein